MDIYTNFAHQSVIGLVNITKDNSLNIAAVAMVKRLPKSFWYDQPGFDSTFFQTFFPPVFKSHHIR